MSEIIPRDVNPRFVDDMAAFVAAVQGRDLTGLVATQVSIEGYQEDWQYSEYTGGSDHGVRVEVMVCAPGAETRERGLWIHRVDGVEFWTVDDFQMGDFMAFVYGRLVVDSGA